MFFVYFKIFHQKLFFILLENLFLSSYSTASISYFKHSSRNKIGNFGLYQHGKLPEKKLSKYKRTTPYGS